MSIELKEKAGVYFLFSRLFREAPSAAFMKEIIEKKLLTLTYYFFEETLPQAALLLENEGWLKKLEELAVEYTSLFVISGKYFIVPYGSFYCDTILIDSSTADSPYFQPEPISQGIKGLIGGPSAAEVKKFYSKEGYAVEASYQYLSDHVACELEFIGKLYADGKVNIAQTFFEGYLGRWAFSFLKKLSVQDYSTFYQTAAVALERFLKTEFVNATHHQNISTNLERTFNEISAQTP